jgi:hypothetical protein
MSSFVLFLHEEERNIMMLIGDNRGSTKEYITNIKMKQEDLSEVNKQLGAIEELYQDNFSKKESIRNLFSLIPAGMRLTYVYADDKKLILKGSVNTKDTYYYKLAIYLRSIFHKSSVDFTKIKNRVYSFKSINFYEKAEDRSIDDLYKQSTESKMMSDKAVSDRKSTMSMEIK